GLELRRVLVRSYQLGTARGCLLKCAYYLLVLRFWERTVIAIIGMTRFWILRIVFRMGSAIIKRLRVRDRFTGWLLIIDSCSTGSPGVFQCICTAENTHAFKSHNDIRCYF